MRRTLLSLFLAIGLSSSGCALFVSKLKIEIPARPAYEQCPTKPDVSGVVKEGNIVLAIPDAVALRDWISAYQVCSESNRVRADGHIEKLENRLKAVGG